MEKGNIGVGMEGAFVTDDIAYIPISGFTLKLMHEYTKRCSTKDDVTPLEVSDMIELACHRWLDKEGFCEEK